MKDYKDATDWYAAAAEQRSFDATCKLTACYAAGLGVPQDCEQAIELLRFAQDGPHAGA